MAHDYLDRLLATDPLKDAEDVLGEGAPEEFVSALGFRKFREVSEEKKRVLAENGDTFYGCTAGHFLDVAASLGFRRERSAPWTYRSGSTHDLVALWHPGGMLLVMTTWVYAHTPDSAPQVNSATLAYNWRPHVDPGTGRFAQQANPVTGKDESLWWNAVGSGGFCSPNLLGADPDPDSQLVWAGTNDVREALRRTVERLREHGTLLTPWEYRPAVHDLRKDVRPEAVLSREVLAVTFASAEDF